MIKIKALILISAGLLISAGASFADRQAEVMGYADIIQAFPGAKTEQFKYKFNIEQPQQIVKAEQPKASGWFSWARNKTANLLDNVGDFLRQPDNLKTDVGQIKHVAKQLTCDVVQAKTQIPVTTKIFSAIGNGARYLAGKFRTEPKTANLNSQLLDQAGINYHSKTNQALIEFKKVSEAFVETGKDHSDELLFGHACHLVLYRFGLANFLFLSHHLRRCFIQTNCSNGALLGLFVVFSRLQYAAIFFCHHRAAVPARWYLPLNRKCP